MGEKGSFRAVRQVRCLLMSARIPALRDALLRGETTAVLAAQTLLAVHRPDAGVVRDQAGEPKIYAKEN